MAAKTYPKVFVATVRATGERYLVRHRYLPKDARGPGDTRVVLWGDVVGWKGGQVYCADGGPSLTQRQVAVEELAAGPALWTELFEQTRAHRRAEGRDLVETTPGTYLDVGNVEDLRREGRALLKAAESDDPLAALLRLKTGF